MGKQSWGLYTLVALHARAAAGTGAATSHLLTVVRTPAYWCGRFMYSARTHTRTLYSPLLKHPLKPAFLLPWTDEAEDEGGGLLPGKGGGSGRGRWAGGGEGGDVLLSCLP